MHFPRTYMTSGFFSSEIILFWSRINRNLFRYDVYWNNRCSMNEEMKGFRNVLENKFENLIGHGSFETMTNVILIVRWKKSSSVEDRFNQNIWEMNETWLSLLLVAEDDWRRFKSCFQMNAQFTFQIDESFILFSKKKMEIIACCFQMCGSLAWFHVAENRNFNSYIFALQSKESKTRKSKRFS